MLVTALTPHLGYDLAAGVANEASTTGRTLREVVLGRNLMEAAALNRALAPSAMTRPQGPSPKAQQKAEQVFENEGGQVLPPAPSPGKK